MSGPTYTVEKAQVIENKRSRLQKLIDMFERQADSYILHHRALENVPIASLTDYSEFDNVDMLDNSELQIPLQLSPPVLQHVLNFADGSGIDHIHAEDLSILLPSWLGWEWCVLHNSQALAEKEAKSPSPPPPLQ